jgi:hypothetical protein
MPTDLHILKLHSETISLFLEEKRGTELKE